MGFDPCADGPLYLSIKLLHFDQPCVVYFTPNLTDGRGLVALQEKAINTLRECMSSPNHMVRVRTALSVLDRVSGMRQGPTSAQSIRQRDLPIGPEDFSDVIRNLYNS